MPTRQRKNRKNRKKNAKPSTAMVAFEDSQKEPTNNQLPVISIINFPFDQYGPTNNETKGSGDLLGSEVSIETIGTVAGNAEDTSPSESPVKVEKWYQTMIQVALPFFIAGIGTIGAGLVLEVVQCWPVFLNVSGIFVLIPSLLGLKGNLDMCLASRLCTQANLGNIKAKDKLVRMIIGNICLVQVQAIVASSLVSVFAITMGQIMGDKFVFSHALLLMVSSIFTATSCCFVLDIVMIAVILFAHKFNFNPDNLATPLAASIGDVISLSCLSAISSILYAHLDSYEWILYIGLAFYTTLLPCWIYVVLRNEYTKHILKSGWTPVLSALIISGMSGLVLDKATSEYSGFVVFQPIINGVGGNLVSVQASRISTMFHQTSILGIIPPHTKTWVSPFAALVKGAPSARTARILIGMDIPGQLLFLFVSDFISQGKCTVTALFACTYLLVTVVQVMFLLYTAHIMIHIMWKLKIDPDNSAIPYLTALGDFSGSSLLLLAFVFLDWLGFNYTIANNTCT